MCPSSSRSPVVVIYVHGLYGSVLVNKKTGRDEWNLPQSLLRSVLFQRNRGHPNVALPMTWSQTKSTADGSYFPVQDEDDIVPTEPLRYTHKGILDYLQHLNEAGAIDLHTPVWDWRRSFEETEPKLATDIDSILDSYCRGDAQVEEGAVLITHSTGALVAWPSLNRRPDSFSTWINIGGCIGGSNSLLKELRYGWGAPGAEVVRLFGPETMFTFPSHPGFFVDWVDGERFGGPGENRTDLFCTNKTTGEKVFLTSKDIDLHDPEIWKRFQLGVYGWKGAEKVTDAELYHLKQTLESARRFRSKHYVRGGAIGDDDDAYLKHDRSAYSHLRIINYGNDDLSTHLAYEVDRERKTVDVTKSGLTAPGDSTILSDDWRYVPGNLKAENITSGVGSSHIPMCGDKVLLDLIGEAVGFTDEDSDHSRARKCKMNGIGAWAGLGILFAVTTGITVQKLMSGLQ